MLVAASYARLWLSNQNYQQGMSSCYDWLEKLKFADPTIDVAPAKNEFEKTVYSVHKNICHDKALATSTGIFLTSHINPKTVNMSAL
ncbi:MAG: hypothetical protein ACI9LO_001183 [Planctomycetota bacterium]